MASSEILEEARFGGHWIVAPSGSGKTNLLLNMYLEDLKKLPNASIIVMDSKGDLGGPISRHKVFAPGQPLAGRLAVLEADANYPLALNPLDLGASTPHTIRLLQYVFGFPGAGQSPLQAILLRAVLIALKATPKATFADFRYFLFKGFKPYERYVRALDPEDAEFFLAGEFDSRAYSETKDQILGQLRALNTRIPTMRTIFRSHETKVNMASLMDGGNVIVINNSKAILGDDGSEFLGRFFIALVRAAAYERAILSPEQKLPVYFYIDECQSVIRYDEHVADILRECHLQRIAMVFAHQALSQMTSPKTLDALSGCAIRHANTKNDPSTLGQKIRTPEHLRSLPTGTFAAFNPDITSGAVEISVPLVGDIPKMSYTEWADARAEMRKKYAIEYELPKARPDVKPIIADEPTKTGEIAPGLRSAG